MIRVFIRKLKENINIRGLKLIKTVIHHSNRVINVYVDKSEFINHLRVEINYSYSIRIGNNYINVIMTGLRVNRIKKIIYSMELYEVRKENNRLLVNIMIDDGVNIIKVNEVYLRCKDNLIKSLIVSDGNKRINKLINDGDDNIRLVNGRTRVLNPRVNSVWIK